MNDTSKDKAIHFEVESRGPRTAVFISVERHLEPRISWSDATQEFSILLADYSNNESNYVHLHLKEKTAKALHEALGKELKMLTGERKWVSV